MQRRGVGEPLELLTLHPPRAAKPEHQRDGRRDRAHKDQSQQHGAERGAPLVLDPGEPHGVADHVLLALHLQGRLQSRQGDDHHGRERCRHRDRSPAGRQQPTGGKQQRGEHEHEGEHRDPELLLHTKRPGPRRAANLAGSRTHTRHTPSPARRSPPADRWRRRSSRRHCRADGPRSPYPTTMNAVKARTRVACWESPLTTSSGIATARAATKIASIDPATHGAAGPSPGPPPCPPRRRLGLPVAPLRPRA